MRYMMFIKHTEDYANAKVPASLYEAMGTFIDEASKKGQFVGGAGLLPTAQGSKVKPRGAKSPLPMDLSRSRRRSSAATR